MKKLLLLTGLSTILLANCSSGKRLGYTHFDDVYNPRPTYSEDKRTTPTSYNNSYSPQTSYSQEFADNQNYSYQDDEQPEAYGNYTERIRRFHSGSSGFDYYSPYYTGFNDGFNYGIGIGTGIGYSTFGRWGTPLWSPYYSSSFYFGWGRPSWSIGFGTWYTPSYFNPFYSPYSYGWSDPWYRYGYGYYGGWGYPSYWGGHSIFRNDYTFRKSNLYYGPRAGSYGNQIYNGPRIDNLGGKNNTGRGSDYGVIGGSPNSGSGIMRYTPKNNSGTNKAVPSSISPVTTPKAPVQKQEKNTNKIMPERYQQPSKSNNKVGSPGTSGGGKKNAVTPQKDIPSRYNSPNNNSIFERKAPDNSPGRIGGGNNFSGGSKGNTGGRSGGSMNRTNK